MKKRNKLSNITDWLIMIPLLLIGSIFILIERLLGKDSNEEWHQIHLDSNMNHGQGPHRD